MKPVLPAFLALLLVAGCSAQSDSGRSPTTQTPVASSTGSQTGKTAAAASSVSPDPNYAPALAKAKHALATLPTLPHARKTSSPPAEQADPPPTNSTRYLIKLSAFWTAPGNTIDAISYLKTHRPPRTGSLPGEYTGPVGQTRVPHKSDPETLTYDAPGATDPLTITFNLVAVGSHVAVRADVEVRWHATKPSSEYLGTVQSVDVTVLRPGAGVSHAYSAPTVHRTLTGAQAQALADLVDADPIRNIFNSSCSGGGTNASDVLVFRTLTRTIRVHDSVTNCAGITVSVNGAQQPTLGGSINLALIRLLKLPAKYEF